MAESAKAIPRAGGPARRVAAPAYFHGANAYVGRGGGAMEDGEYVLSRTAQYEGISIRIYRPAMTPAEAEAQRNQAVEQLVQILSDPQ
jgi:hypothetical protein